MKKVVFRLDAGKIIGSGHFYRAKALIESFNSRGWKCDIVTRPHEGYTNDILVKTMKKPKTKPVIEEYSSWVGSSQENDALEFIEFLDDETKLIVVDHFGLDSVWEKIVSKTKITTLAIDDLTNRTHCADFLLDTSTLLNRHTPGKKGISLNTQIISGPEYSIFRNEITKTQKWSEKNNEKKKILINFGSADPENKMIEVLKILEQQQPSSIEALAISGECNLDHEKILRFAQNNDFIECLKHSENFGELVAQSDVVIGAGGMSALERCLIGVPSISVPIVSNQIETLKNLEKLGTTLVFQLTELEKAVIKAIELSKDTNLKKEISDKCKSNFNANGKELLIKKLGF